MGLLCVIPSHLPIGSLDVLDQQHHHYGCLVVRLRFIVGYIVFLTKIPVMKKLERICRVSNRSNTNPQI